MELHWIIEA